MQYESSADACNPGSGKIDTDGWYIDFAEGTHSCERPERQVFQGNPKRLAAIVAKLLREPGIGEKCDTSEIDQDAGMGYAGESDGTAHV